MSPSAKLAVTCIGPTWSWIALPDGARTPGTTPTAETMPSAGAVSVAAATWMVACRTVSWALAIEAWSDASVEAVALAVRLVYESWADVSERRDDASWSDAVLADDWSWSLSDASWSWALVMAPWSALIVALGGPAARSAVSVAWARWSAAWAWLSLSAFCCVAVGSTGAWAAASWSWADATAFWSAVMVLLAGPAARSAANWTWARWRAAFAWLSLRLSDAVVIETFR